ncbi:hypothetical protein ABZZ79_12455 [Streptomyces sp. NPDC006458]|uniref:hypothetical protein n=1 Tax=Streptomyces sp. NPDC006458 TaxID=3154302 RepID=UPI0033B696ED
MSENEIAQEPIREQAEAAGGGRARRRRAAVVAACALTAAAVLAGVGATAVTVRDADRSAGAPTWKFPKPRYSEDTTDGKADEERPDGEQARAAASLTALLVPYDAEGYVQGPDIEELGSEAELTGDEATARLGVFLEGLPRSARRDMERMIEKRDIRAKAMRSYASQDTARFARQGVFTVSVELTQLGNRTAVRGYLEAVRSLAGLEEVDEGPEIKGYKDAECLRGPLDEDEELEMLFCAATVGDIVVAITTQGADPLDDDEVTRFVRTQLDRIDAPGKTI